MFSFPRIIFLDSLGIVNRFYVRGGLYQGRHGLYLLCFKVCSHILKNLKNFQVIVLVFIMEIAEIEGKFMLKAVDLVLNYHA